MLKRILFTFICIYPYLIQAQEFTELTVKKDISFRGLVTYKEKVVWISGSKGTIGRSVDQGVTWEWFQPAGYEQFDFRSIVAFSDKEAIVVSAGTPAVILRTRNAGKTWTEVYRNEDPQIFLDASYFVGKHGYVLGDPIDGKFQLLESKDKGKTWKDVSEEIPLLAEEGEAAFAASGSSMQMINDWVYIGTGGQVASLMKRNKKESRLDVVDAPIWSGESGTGVFSIDFLNQRIGVLVGGNYMQDQDNRNNILLTYNGGLSWEKPENPISGYRSCVKYINKDVLVATGTSGTDLSRDAGKNWIHISKRSFNVLAKSGSGSRIYLAGSHGDIVLLKLP